MLLASQRLFCFSSSPKIHPTSHIKKYQRIWWDKTRNVIQPADPGGWGGRHKDNDITYLRCRLHIQHIALSLVHKLWRVLLPLVRIVIGRCQHFNLIAFFGNDLFVLLLLFHAGCCWIVGLDRDRRCFLLEAATAWGDDFHSTRSLLLFGHLLASWSCYSYKLGRLRLGLLRFATTDFQSVGPGLAFGRDDGCGGRFSLGFGCAFASSATFWLGLTDRFGVGDGVVGFFALGSLQTSMVVEHAHCWLQIEKLDRINFANACVGGLPCHDQLMEFFGCRMFGMAQEFGYSWKENRISVR